LAGSLDREEFTLLLLNLDGEITRASVDTSLATTGVFGEQDIQLWHFYSWVQAVFNAVLTLG